MQSQFYTRRTSPLVRISHHRCEVTSLWCGGVTYSSTFSIIRMNVNTVERALLLSQGIYLDYIWTLFFRKKRSMIWSLVIRLLGKDFTKSSGSFSVLISKTMNKGPTFYYSKTQVFFKNPCEYQEWYRIVFSFYVLLHQLYQSCY